MLKRLDGLVHRRFFPSRSKAIQDALEEKLKRIDKSRLATECLSAAALCYSLIFLFFRSLLLAFLIINILLLVSNQQDTSE